MRFSLPEKAGSGDRRQGWAGLGVALLAFFGGLLAAGLLGGVYVAARGLTTDENEGDLGLSLISSAGLWVGFLVIPLLWARRRGGLRQCVGLAGRWTDIPVGVGVGVLSSLVTLVVSSAVLTREQVSTLEDKADNVVDRAQGPLASVLLVIALCLVTPLAEEVFFRGLLFRSLYRVAPMVVAAVTASVIFGLVHYDGKPVPGVVLAVQIGLLSLFGLALCLLGRATGRIGAGIVAHATFNAITVVGLLLRR